MKTFRLKISLFLLVTILGSCSKGSWDLFEGNPYNGLPSIELTAVEPVGGKVRVSFTVSTPGESKNVSNMGVCYSYQYPEPLMHENQKLLPGEAGDFSVMLSNLNPGTTYFIRAFATNESGYVYSEVHEYTH